ncbi:hypothetical protein JG687_00001785 [Phytophthora cactorum]|uniref:Uncharacterized protein n=1 Tax=Phytophthora cactorum TaxID=29920 RepID=A0A8T1UWR3_9STRA|nr:hypothetical protein JG687_00001785 [Phytophthora cactorum]
MGAGPSLGKFLKSMDDDDLAKLVESVRHPPLVELVEIGSTNGDQGLFKRLEPQRMEKMFVLAKQRYYEGQL